MSPIDAANARLEILEMIFEEFDVTFDERGGYIVFQLPNDNPHPYEPSYMYERIHLTETEWESLTPLMPDPIPHPEKEV